MSAFLQKDKNAHDALLSPGSVIGSDLIKPKPKQTRKRKNDSSNKQTKSLVQTRFFVKNPFSILQVKLSSLVFTVWSQKLNVSWKTTSVLQETAKQSG